MSFIETVRVCGVVGILASLGMLVADILLYGRSDSFKRLPFIERAAGLPFWRLNVANALGVGLIPIVALGFVPLFYALRPSGVFAALVVAGSFVYFMGMGAGTHASTVDQYLLHRARERQTNNSPEAKVLDSVISEQGKLQCLLSWMVRIALLLGSLIYSVLVLIGNTHLPAWMAIINPFLLTAFAIYSERWMPSAIAGYLYPIKVYFGIIPLQVLTLIFVWNFV
jgi:hypothetical protein